MTQNSLQGCTIRVKLFHFDNFNTIAGAQLAHETTARINEFLAEHSGSILDVQFTGRDVMVIYEI